MYKLSIYTDASFVHDPKVGAFAYRTFGGCFLMTNAGLFVNPPYDIHDAEVRAIGKAVAAIIYSPDVPDFEKLEITTDSLVAIDRIKSLKDDASQSVYASICFLIRKHKAKSFELIHIKAHNGIDTKGEKANNWCDKQAKYKLRAEVELIKNTQIDASNSL